MAIKRDYEPKTPEATMLREVVDILIGSKVSPLMAGAMGAVNSLVKMVDNDEGLRTRMASAWDLVATDWPDQDV